jgi:hypothetical protein
VSGFAARTQTPGLVGRDYAYNVDSEYDDGRHRTGFEWGKTGEDFNPEVGFVENPEGYRRYLVRFEETVRQQRVRDWGFRELLPHATYTRYDYLDGGLNNAELHIDNHWDWENGNFFTLGLNGTWDGLREPFEVYPGIIVPAGDHGGLRLTWRANTDRRKRVYARLQWDHGRFLTGHQNSPTVAADPPRQRPADARFNVELPVDRSASGRVSHQSRQHAGDLQLHAVGLRAEPRAVQRPDGSLVYQPAVSLAQTAATGLFVVYNDTESLNGIGPVNRAFIVKYVRQFDM